MSDDRKYIRVYYSIRSDDRFESVYGDDAALACWLRLLLDADAVWPAPASVPRAARSSAYQKLVTAGIVEPMPGHLYRIHGLDHEREMRSQSGRNAAAVRWHSEPDADPMPRRAETSRDETSKAEQDDGRCDIEAFVAVRRRIPTPAQRAFMDAYCQTFDQTGPERASRLIWANPDDPIGAMKADLQEWREQRRAEAMASEVPKPVRKRKASSFTGVNAEIANALRSVDKERGSNGLTPLADLLPEAVAAIGYHAGGHAVPKPGRKP